MVPVKVKQINHYLFIDDRSTYKPNKIKISMNEIIVNDSEKSMR